MLPAAPMPMFDLDAYVSRIGLAGRPAPDAGGLLALQRAHRLAIPFENLDIPLGRGISLAPDAVFAKLVGRRRGGYCFEQNQLFLRALRALGFAARPLLARVWLMATDVPPLTHTLNLVTIGGRDWIADAGFGGSFSPPMPVEDGTVVTGGDGTAHRLVTDPALGWVLERAGDPAATDGRTAGHGDWQRQYSFTLAPVAPVDLELSNHWTSTRPATRFTTLRVVSRILPDGFASLVDDRLSLVTARGSENRTITGPDDYQSVLADLFGLAMTASDVDRLHQFQK